MSKKSMSRRTALSTVAALGGGACFGFKRAYASAYPNQTVNFIIPYGPGGSFDAYGRKFSALLQQNLPNHVNVEPINTPGAAGREAIFQLLQDKPDGYNISLINIPGILMGKSGGAVNVDKLSWIANLGRDTYGLAVSKSGPIKNVADLQALGKQRTLKFSSTGPGSTDFFAAKVFAASLGINISLVIGYSDSPNSVVAVARGDVDCVVHSLSTLNQMEKSGLVKVIFVFQNGTSLPGVEDAASINKPDLGEIFQWRPVVGPSGLPPEIVSTLSNALVASAKTQDAQSWAAVYGTGLYPLNQTDTVAMVKQQKSLIDKWKSVLS